MEGGGPGHFVLQHGWHCCTSCLSLTNLTASTAVQSLLLPTAEIWRGVWRGLAQSQGAESTRTSTWLATSARRKQTLPQAAAKETSCVHILSQHLHPKPCHFYSALHPQGLPGGWDPGALPAALGWRSRGQGAPSPALLLGREDILASLAPGSACWASCSCCSHPTVTPQLPITASMCPQAPHPRGTPTLPPAVSSLPATLLLPGLPSWLFWKHFLKQAR